MTAIATAAFTLRCHSCSHALGESAIPMHLVAMFRPSALGAVPATHTMERRHRCVSCRWVNVFHPTARTREVIETK